MCYRQMYRAVGAALRWVQADRHDGYRAAGGAGVVSTAR
jgi:hypothetical protein